MTLFFEEEGTLELAIPCEELAKKVEELKQVEKLKD